MTLHLSFRYIPIGLLEVIPQQMQWRPPAFVGRSDLETLLASESPSDWVHISEMLLGRTPPGHAFAPKHKSNAYSAAPRGGGGGGRGAGRGGRDQAPAASGEGEMAMEAYEEANG